MARPKQAGYISVTHVKSNKVFLTVTADIDREIANAHRKLRNFEHSNDELQDLYMKDPTIAIGSFPFDTRELAAQAAAAHADTLREEGRLLNGRTKQFNNMVTSEGSAPRERRNYV